MPSAEGQILYCPRTCLGAGLLLSALTAGCVAAPRPDDAAPTRTGDKPAKRVGKRVEFAPSVVVDFAKLQVEVESEVVLREGLLELLACSPRTKEHESILRVRARPLHVYEALGLIGLKPGRPAGWDAKKNRRIPARGDPLTILIRYRADDKDHEVNAWEWLRSLEKGKAAEPRPWVFAGSTKSAKDDLAADHTGEVISVVTFGTEIVGLSEFHSTDNAELWLEPFAERIPPVGTRCTLIFRPADKKRR